MLKVNALPPSVDIGYTGEKKFRTVEIDLTEWVKDMPEGTPALVCQRGAETPYRPTVTLSEGILSWNITSADLGLLEGKGRMQCEMTEGNKVRKSAIVQTWIHKGIMR